MKNTNDRHVGGIALKDTRRLIESPVRFLSDLLLSGSHIGEHKSWWRSFKYGLLYEMFVDNRTEFSFLIGPFFRREKSIQLSD